MTHTVVGLFDDINHAHMAVRDLQDMGIARDRISLVASDAAGEYGQYLSRTGAKEDTTDGASTGAGVGALIGGIGGLLVGLGALAIPGIGPVVAAGPLATALSALLGAGAGALAGGIAGGLIGALVDAGLPEEEAGYYAEGVRRGGTLLMVETDEAMSQRAADVLNRHGAVDVHERARGWREQGWAGYNPKAEPYTMDQIRTERERYRPMGVGQQDMAYTPSATGTTGGYRGSQMYTRGTAGMGDYATYSTAWRGHYQTHLANRGYDFTHYEPAYRFGYDLRNDTRYRDYNDWSRLEPMARTDWERRSPGTWEEFKDSVRYAWESFKQKVRD